MPIFTPPLTQGSAFPSGVRVGNLNWARYADNGVLLQSLSQYSNGAQGVLIGIDYPYMIVPSAGSNTNLFPTQSVANAGTLTLTAGAGITVDTKTYPGYTAYSFDYARNVNVSVTNTPNPIICTVSGWDMYGVKVVEQFTIGAGTNVGDGNKAFKAIHTIQISAATGAGTISFGQGIYFGLPYALADPSFIFITWNGVIDYLYSGGTGMGCGCQIITLGNNSTATSSDPRGMIGIFHTMDGNTPLLAYMVLPYVDPIYTRGKVVDPIEAYGLPQYSTGWL